MVTARFKVTRHTPWGDKDNPSAVEVEVTPDYANGANHEWSQATPSGVCRLTITNMAAVEQLPEGQSLEIQFHQLAA
jgi:hypothetical protein